MESKKCRNNFISVSTGKIERTMKVCYKPFWKTRIDWDMSKQQLRMKAHSTTNYIANMGKRNTPQ